MRSDTTPPTVTSVVSQTGEAIAEGSAVTHEINSIVVQFSRDMSTVGGAGGANSVTNPANYELLECLTDITGSITGITYPIQPRQRVF
jgi:hypothetical protein